MLSIGRLGLDGGRYYTKTVASGQEDYYTGSGEAPGAWAGTAAGELGLSGTVEEGDFEALLRGLDPSLGKALRTGLVPTKVPGFDLTFSAPKSVSVLYAVGDDRVSAAAREAHDEAVRQALGYLEHHAAKVRRGRAGRHIINADGLAVATFRHRSSRAGDPQLHTHAVVANLAPAGGRWSGLDSRSLYAHARTAGFLYQAALRDQLTRQLGVQWEPVINGMAEIQGIDRDLLRHFSQRRIDIEQQLQQLGAHSRKAREKAALDTRRTKPHAVPVDRLRADWQARAAEHGFGRQQIAALLHRPARDHLDDVGRAQVAEQLAGPGGVTRNASSFDRRDALRDWAAAHRAGATVAEVERVTDLWLTGDEVVPLQLARGRRPLGGDRYTTVAMLQIETALIDTAQRRRDTNVAIAPAAAVKAAIEQRPDLAPEQAIAVRALTRSGDGVQVLRAAAGTGKTYALDAAREAWETDDRTVLGCALSARAAVELQDHAGIRSTTIARLQHDLSHGYGLPRGGVLIVDEAGMVGSRDLAALAAHAERAEAKLVLVGDDHQLPEIDAGGGLRGIAKRLGALELHEVRRQRHDWDRQALDDLRHGRITAWAQRYRDHGRLHAYPTSAAARDALAADWWTAARKPDSDVVMIAHRRADVADLNRRARQHMANDGRLGADQLEAGGREFTTGDRVLARRNDRRLGVINGTRAVVTEVDPQARAVAVTTPAGETIRLDADYLNAGHLDHGYALTAHAAQGATVDQAYILGTDDVYREWGYTALSRHRDQAHYYLTTDGHPAPTLPGLEPSPDPLLEDLTDQLHPSRRKDLAHDTGQPLPRSTGRDPFTEARRVERERGRAAAEAQLAAEATAAAEARLAALQAELAQTSRLRVAARAELRDAIDQAQAVVHCWSQRTTELAAATRPTDLPSPEPEGRIQHPDPNVEPAPAPDLSYTDEFDLGP